MVSRHGILCHDRGLAKTKGSLVAIELARSGVFCRDIMFLCRNKVCNEGEALCSDKIFYVEIKCGQMEWFLL